MNQLVFRLLLVLAALMTGLAGCRSHPPLMTVDLVAHEQINKNVDGVPSPVTVSIYQLKASQDFLQADFFTLREIDSASDVLLAKKEIQVTPGETQHFSLEILKEARYLGVAAGFREIDQAQWREVRPLPEKKLHKYWISVRLKDKKVLLNIQRL